MSSVTSQPNKVDLLIGGGGPVGVCLAIFASKLGLTVRILEQNDAIHSQGRADSLNPRTLETFSLVNPALTSAMIAPGKMYTRICTYKDGKIASETAWKIQHCKWENIAFLPQYLIEKNLQDHLREYFKIELDRPKRLSAVEVLADDDGISSSNAAPIRAVAKHAQTGEEEVIEASFYAGCDGGKSVSRKALGIEREGNLTEISWYVMDASLESFDLPTKDVALNSIQSDMGGVFVLPIMENFYRVTTNVAGEDKDLTKEEIMAFAKKAAEPYKLEFGEIHWFTHFRVVQLCANQFSVKNRAFLAGDAAHLNGPSGAIGMQTGIADAFDLSWKLYLVKHGLSNLKLLETYNTERRHLALQVIGISEELAKLQQQIEEQKVKAQASNTTVQLEFAKAWDRSNNVLTGLGTKYKETVLSLHNAGAGEFKILGGQRFPDAPVFEAQQDGSVSKSGKAKMFYDHLSFTVTFRIIIFPGDLASTNSIIKTIDEYLGSSTAFTRRYRSPNTTPLFQPITVLRAEDSATALIATSHIFSNPILVDAAPEKENTLYNLFGIDDHKGGIFVLRPDTFIGCAYVLADFKELENYFSAFLIANPSE